MADVSTIYKSDAGAHAVRDRYRELLNAWPVPSEQRMVQTRQGETFIVSCGPADAPPVILLQGSGANAAMWLGDVAHWAKQFRLHAVDVIGEPGLSAPARPPLASDAYAHWLDDVMTGLAVARASFVGVSLGGWLALDFATRHPERIDRLVLLAPSGVGRQKMSVVFKALLLLALGRWGRRRAMRMVAGARPANATSAPPAGLMGLIVKHFRPRRVKLPIFGDDALRRLTMPVLLVVGARDALLDSAGTRQRLERTTSNLTVQFLPEAGHLLPRQTELIASFLDGASR